VTSKADLALLNKKRDVGWQGNCDKSGLELSGAEVLKLLVNREKKTPCKSSIDKWLDWLSGKHQSEIINYNRRSPAGKTIGSGRMDRWWCGQRQKG